MIVQNISGRDLRIVELKKILPAGDAYYSLPFNIAQKYKNFLKPIQMNDDNLQALNNNRVNTPNVPVKQGNRNDAIAAEIAAIKAAAANNKHDPKTETRESVDVYTDENTVGIRSVAGAPVVIQRIPTTDTFVEESKQSLKKDGTPKKKPGRKAKQ